MACISKARRGVNAILASDQPRPSIEELPSRVDLPDPPNPRTAIFYLPAVVECASWGGFEHAIRFRGEAPGGK